ncbi:MAG: PrgI family protein [Candidatus Saccharibacteria bacterium]|nr:PrgI family protein [Candidatus Saccharibacteria bacterium]
MAQYKVPQDVEADDKLIGPFSFRQFVYLLIAAGLIAAAVGLAQLFPLLAIIPLPPVLLLLALALPLRKDQPMETYLAAIVSYYLKPRNRVWTPGQRESTILITAPKIVEEVRTRDLSQEEATHRLSFLADIVDTEGRAIRGGSLMRDDLVAEANTATDMFDNTNHHSQIIDRAINQEKQERHTQAINEMRAAIERSDGVQPSPTAAAPAIIGAHGAVKKEVPKPDVVVMPEMPKPVAAPETPATPEPVQAAKMSDVVVQPTQNVQAKAVKPDIMELANNSDYSVATIAKEANRINRKEEGEVFISLH